MNTFKWSRGVGWEAWEANFHITNMGGKLATLLVGHDDEMEGGLFVTLPDEVCPPNERKGYLPSKTRLPLNQSNLDLCIHDYITIRSAQDSDIPQIEWGTRKARPLKG